MRQALEINILREYLNFRATRRSTFFSSHLYYPRIAVHTSNIDYFLKGFRFGTCHCVILTSATNKHCYVCDCYIIFEQLGLELDKEIVNSSVKKCTRRYNERRENLHSSLVK